MGEKNGSHPGYDITFVYHVSLGSSWIWVSQTFPVFVRFFIWVFCKMPLFWSYWLIFFFFLMIRLGLWILGRKTLGVKSHFYRMTSRVHVIKMISCWAWSADWRSATWFHHCKLLLCFFSLSLLYFLKEVTMCSPHLRSRDLCSVLRTELSVLFGIPLQGRFVSFLPYMHLFSHFLISVCIHGYWFYSLGYNPVLFYLLLRMSQDWAFEALLVKFL